MQSVQGLAFAEGGIDLLRRRTVLATSEGTAIDQTTVQSGAGIEATATAEGELQRRSFPNSFRGHISAAGWECTSSGWGRSRRPSAPRPKRLSSLSAKDCPSEVTTLVIDSGQVELQIHESTGTPSSLDRVLDGGGAYAGSSFVKPDDRGKLRRPRARSSRSRPTRRSPRPRSFGWDDEGVPAQRMPIIEDGVFQNFISSRETASVLGLPSSGAMRADGWAHHLLIRMTNISPSRARSLADILGDTKDGVFMSTNTSRSIDDHRVNFQFGCEIAWRIKDGKLTEMYRNPNYTGITTEFWGSCDAVGGRSEWTVWGTPNCGKGQPGQVARVGHGASPARFRNVQLGVRG